MATIDSKDVIKDLLINNGKYFDDPQCHTIWSYVNSRGDKTQAIFYNVQDDLVTSQYVRSPRLLWSKHNGLTPDGKAWLYDNYKISM